MPMSSARALLPYGLLGRGLLLAMVVTLLGPLLPAATVPVAAAGGKGWEARQIGEARVKDRDRTLAAQLPGGARLGYHPRTGRVRFLSGTPNRPLSGGLPGLAAGKRTITVADARTKSRRFVERYGALFGLADPARELRVGPTRLRPVPGPGVAAGAPASATVRLSQHRGGIPVMGGELVLQLSADGEVISVVGEVLPSVAEAPGRPRIGVTQARNLARRWIARETSVREPAVVTTSEGLAYYDPRIMDDPNLRIHGARLVWRIDARVAAAGPRPADHRLVIVDALAGQVLTTIGRIVTAGEGPNRRICDNRNLPGKPWVCEGPFARVEGQGPSGIADVDAAYQLMGVTYDYFASRFGRDGIDGQGSRMKATVRYCPRVGCPWHNAEWRWAPQQATFGRGWAQADDIVAHEYMHGVLDAEAPLFYQYQSGAINEAFADVFGEAIDLANRGRGDGPAAGWKIGEDTPGGAFRDMRRPGRYGHPDRVRSPRWHKGVSDYGGVHRNSGVANKAAYLMAAGGRFRGFRIKGIGIERTARVWYQALTTRLTSAANYVDLGDALAAACTDLVGTSGFTPAHCISVRKATRATQMHMVPLRGAPATAPVCGPAQQAATVFFDDLEDPGSGAWVAMRTVGRSAWFWPQNPNDTPGWDGSWSSSGRYNFYAADRGTRSDSTMRMTGNVLLPRNAFLRFGHGYSFDKDARRRYDGAVVEIKVDEGPWRNVDPWITHGKYNGTIARNTGNPIGGRRAWTGDSRGWARTRIDLRRFAGHRVRVRFRMASDRSFGGRGWYIDDVRIFACVRDHDKPSGTLLIDGGAPTTPDTAVTLGLTWADATTWVTEVRLSNSPALDAAGVLQAGLTLPPQAEVAWDLADPALGGSADPGVKAVYAQVRDAVGNWSDVFLDQVELLAPAP